jgi:hypothetical protein
VVTVKSRAEGLKLLEASKVDGFASDRTTLIGLVVASPQAGAFRLLDEDFSVEPYALALPRATYEFRLAVNRVLARLYRSGEIVNIYNRWLGRLGPPSLLLSGHVLRAKHRRVAPCGRRTRSEAWHSRCLSGRVDRACRGAVPRARGPRADHPHSRLSPAAAGFGHDPGGRSVHRLRQDSVDSRDPLRAQARGAAGFPAHQPRPSDGSR